MDEIRSLRTIAEAGRKKNPTDEISYTDFTLGIYQSIGERYGVLHSRELSDAAQDIKNLTHTLLLRPIFSFEKPWIS